MTSPAYFRAFLLAFCLATAARADEPTPADLEYFEKKVRPLLVKHCHECHGPEGEASGNLRLDGEVNWLKGGDIGPAIVPGKPDESLLIRATRYGGEIEMPPTGKLSDQEIAIFEQWIARGAPAPKGEGTAVVKRSIDIEKGREFWSYRPLTSPKPPPVNATVDSPIDAFIIARLQEKGLASNPEASREVLIRRLYFDLVGLPPSPEQIDAFLADSSDEAYDRLVDQLLESPPFGERWGRHWLDVARFGESLTLRGFVLPQAWRYRDYVIDAFNRDLPYDQFIREQIAGDLLAGEIDLSNVEERQRRAIAATFLTLGNHNLEQQDKRQLDMDVVDEQLDVIGKAFLAQTITCARCHDHKFDPIPTRDYYALAGILHNTQLLEHANVSQWIEVALPASEELRLALESHQQTLKESQQELAELNKQITELRKELGENGDLRVVAVSELPGVVVDDAEAKQVGDWRHSQVIRPYIGNGYLHDDNAGKGEKTLTFTPKIPRDGRYEVRLAYSPGDSRSAAAPVTIFGADGEKTVHVNMKQTPPIDGRFVSLGEYRFEAAGQSFVIVANEGTQGHVTADCVQFLPLDASEKPPEEKPAATAERDARKAELQKKLDRQGVLQKSIKAAQEALDAQPKTMAVRERPQPTDCPIHVRGSVHTLGEMAPRGFLQVASIGPPPPMPSNESGRRELADWIASPQNPLTARVYVNRVWRWLFGEGLVRSVDNFGTTGETPSHPELLDYLAAEFLRDGCSTKRLIRRIVRSQTYRQSSQERPDGLSLDPENRWLWRMSRKRLEAECLHDAMLAISGDLDPTRGGPTYPARLAADYGYRHSSLCRSVYLPVFRNSLPDHLEVFDFADPSMVVGARNVSTIAPQALYLLNHPFPRERARSAAKRLLAECESGAARIDRACRLCLGRLPLPEEREIFENHLKSSSASPEETWTTLIHSLFASLDFRYRD